MLSFFMIFKSRSSDPARNRQVKYNGVQREWSDIVGLLMIKDDGTAKEMQTKRDSIGITTTYERPSIPYTIRPPARVPIVTAPKPPQKLRIPTSFTASLLNQSPLIRVCCVSNSEFSDFSAAEISKRKTPLA